MRTLSVSCFLKQSGQSEQKHFGDSGHHHACRFLRWEVAICPRTSGPRRVLFPRDAPRLRSCYVLGRPFCSLCAGPAPGRAPLHPLPLVLSPCRAGSCAVQRGESPPRCEDPRPGRSLARGAGTRTPSWGFLLSSVTRPSEPSSPSRRLTRPVAASSPTGRRRVSHFAERDRWLWTCRHHRAHKIAGLLGTVAQH